MVEGKDSLQISAAWETEEWVTSLKKMMLQDSD